MYTYFMAAAGSPLRSARCTVRTQKTRVAVERYLEACRWRRVVERRLRAVGLTFAQWLVLDATNALIRETKDAVNQNDVARRTELDRMTVSQVMRTLAKQGHVDRDTDMIGRGYRIWVTSKGEKTLALAENCVTAPRRPP